MVELLPLAGGRPDPFESAAGWADLHWRRFLGVVTGGRPPRTVVRPLWERRARAAALVYRLCRQRRGRGYAAVPRDRVAGWLGVRPGTAGETLRWLADEERCVIEFRCGADGEPAYHHLAGEAREARYLGDPPAAPVPPRQTHRPKAGPG